MGEKTELQKVGEEAVRFMRGRYNLDEVPGKYYDIDCLKFRQGKKTILSINIHKDHYDFQIIFDRAEREKFESRRGEFPDAIQGLYDNAHTYHDGKWMLIRVDNMSALEVVKQLILIKKNPNRKPFPKEHAVYGDCGHRCDLCVHYTGETISEEFRMELLERINRVYGSSKTLEEARRALNLCNGCGKSGFGESCPQRKCALEKGARRCLDCPEYDCGKATVGYRKGIEARSISADDVTWAILPYVDGQYGN